MKKALLSMLVFGITLAYAGTSYRVNLYRPTKVRGTDFKAGECKVELLDGKVVLKQGKLSAEASAKIETTGQKFSSTSVGYAAEGSGSELQEIRLGGTATKVLIESGGAAVAGSK